MLVPLPHGRYRLELADGTVLTFNGNRWHGGPARRILEELERTDPGTVPATLLPRRGRPSPSRLRPAERRADAAQLHAGGMTYDRLGVRLATTYGRFEAALRDRYPALGSTRRRKLTYGDVAELGAGKMTLDRLADVFDVDRSTIARDLAAHQSDTNA